MRRPRNNEKCCIHCRYQAACAMQHSLITDGLQLQLVLTNRKAQKSYAGEHTLKNIFLVALGDVMLVAWLSKPVIAQCNFVYCTVIKNIDKNDKHPIGRVLLYRENIRYEYTYDANT